MKKVLLLVSFFAVNLCLGQGNGYKTPPKEIADLLLAKPTPGISVNEKGSWMLLIERNSYPSVEELAQPELRISPNYGLPDNASTPITLRPAGKTLSIILF
jgi:hypothetical protein